MLQCKSLFVAVTAGADLVASTVKLPPIADLSVLIS